MNELARSLQTSQDFAEVAPAYNENRERGLGHIVHSAGRLHASLSKPGVASRFVVPAGSFVETIVAAAARVATAKPELSPVIPMSTKSRPYNPTPSVQG